MCFHPPKSVSSLLRFLSTNPIRLHVTPAREVDPRAWLRDREVRFGRVFQRSLAHGAHHSFWVPATNVHSQELMPFLRDPMFCLGASNIQDLFYSFSFSSSLRPFFSYESPVLSIPLLHIPYHLRISRRLLVCSAWVYVFFSGVQDRLVVCLFFWLEAPTSAFEVNPRNTIRLGYSADGCTGFTSRTYNSAIVRHTKDTTPS